MKATEFVKNCGIDSAKSLLKMGSGYCDIMGYEFHTDELKRLVESHDYIKSLGGISFVKDNLPLGYFGDGNYKELIQECLEDVESCL